MLQWKCGLADCAGAYYRTVIYSKAALSTIDPSCHQNYFPIDGHCLSTDHLPAPTVVRPNYKISISTGRLYIGFIEQ